MRIRYPNAVEVAGEVVEVAAPDRIVFTYGYVSGQQVPPGGSRVTIRLEADARGTRLHLMHEFAEAATRATITCRAGAISCRSSRTSSPTRSSHGAARWSTPGSRVGRAGRGGATSACSARSPRQPCRMRDRFSCIEGIDELTAHIGAAQRFMPGVRMQADGAIRHCQGMVLAGLDRGRPDASNRRARGRTSSSFGPDGRIESVTGLLAHAPA